MKSGAVAQQYAKAAFDSLGKGKSEKTVMELKSFANAVRESKELFVVTCSAMFSHEKRWVVIEELAKRAKWSAETLKLLRVLSVARRLDYAEAVAEKLEILILEASDVISLKVESADEISGGEKAKIQSRFKGLLGKEVAATYRVVPGLYGGLRVTAAGRSYDGTLFSNLNRLRETLVGGS